MPHPIFETPILHRYRVSVVSVMDHLERLSEGSFGLAIQRSSPPPFGGKLHRHALQYQLIRSTSPPE
eukprot:scaffold19821_cov166-Skeletonema_marinoi.AAC.8